MSLTKSFARPLHPAVLACAASAVAAHAAGGGGSIRALPCGDNGQRRLVAVTPDGSVCAGNDATNAFRWTDAGGFDPLGPGFSLSTVGISDGGDTVVGYRRDESMQRWEAYRWTASSGMQSLGGWPNDRLGEFSYYASGVTGDGMVAVGSGEGAPGGAAGGTVAFRWAESTGMTPLGWLNDPEFVALNSWAAAVTPDGSTIVGSCSGVVDGVLRWQNAVRWDAVGVAHALGSGPAWLESSATAVSADGSVIAGTALLPDSGYRAVRWDAAGNALDLGVPLGAQQSGASGISGDGSVVVGECLMNSSAFFSACIWTQSTGFITLTDFLLANGIDTSGWDSLESATAISRNGRVIVGTGTYQGCYTSFIVDLGDPASACPADLNGDGNVAGFDLGMLLANWEGQGTGDLDQSGFVNGADLGLLLSAWGPCSGG